MQAIKQFISRKFFYFTYLPLIVAIASSGLYFEQSVILILGLVFHRKNMGKILPINNFQLWFVYSLLHLFLSMHSNQEYASTVPPSTKSEESTEA